MPNSITTKSYNQQVGALYGAPLPLRKGMTMDEWECDCRADAIFKTEADYDAHFETDPAHKEDDE
jgi:hypothetical protein